MALLNLARYRAVVLWSVLVHGMVAATLWFNAPDWVSERLPEQSVINAIILPSVPAEDVKAPLSDGLAELKKASSPVVTSIEKPKPFKPASIENVSNDSVNSKIDTPNHNNAAEQTHTNAGAANANNMGAEGQNSGDVIAGNGTAQNAPTVNIKGVPVDVQIKDSHFEIWYDVEAKYKSTEKAGEARLIFNRTGATYRAELSSKASIAAFNATSEGEVRDNTIATTRFKDGRTISFLGVGKERGGSHFIVDYPTRRITFKGKGADNTQALSYDAVYDYLAAIVYVQAVLQSKQGQVSSLSLPIGKRDDIAKANVVFGAREPRLSLPEGVFDAIPASINIPSGSIQSMRIWFVPKKQYRPLQIEIGFKSGQVLLRSRQSN